MSVTKSLTKSYNQENQLISIIQELNHNQSNTNAAVIWIPAHQGLEENEKADAAVKEATVPLLTNNHNHLPISCDDQIIHCKKVIKNEWNNTWKTTKSIQLYKSIQDIHQQTPKFKNRKEGIIITHLRTKLTHEHETKKTTPPTCTHCNNHPLTITHILHNVTPQKAKDRNTESTQT